MGDFFADGAWTFPVGKVSPGVARLLRVAEDALYVGIAEARPGKRIGDIGYAIDRFVRRHGYSVVKEMVGHGIGRSLHEEPQVPNYGKIGKGVVLKEGMTFCIEPMVNSGKRDIESLSDEWTIVTADHSLSAHFEHTVAIGPDGPDILSLVED